ncbi:MULTISPECIES: hemin ABC transporter substrate-binding protein [unclassified Streptomyces]|uniref:Hemin ABC transporter substrate-binding protein n=1 Tax=Streptomyces thermocoprophilus TaxID=78356 RepID=A0ABV5VLP3_9ACTN
MRTRLAGALLGMLALTTATGCGADTVATPSPTATADAIEPLAGTPTPRLPVTVDSADGRKVTVSRAERIVPLSGSLSEIVFTLGLGDRVVARDVTTTFAQAAKLPVVTRNHDVSAESVLSLKPGLVIAETTTGPDEAVAQIRAAGVPVLVVAAAKSLDDVGPRIRTVARALGVPDAGQELAERSRQRIDAVRRTIPGHEEKPRVAFLYLRGSASVHLIGGRESGAGSLIEAAGGIDAGAESGIAGDFATITSEALVKAAPDAILVMDHGLESVGGIDGLVTLPGVAQTPAGMNRRVVSVEDGVLLTYGPRTDRVLATVVDQLYGGGDA